MNAPIAPLSARRSTSVDAHASRVARWKNRSLSRSNFMRPFS